MGGDEGWIKVELLDISTEVTWNWFHWFNCLIPQAIMCVKIIWCSTLYYFFSFFHPAIPFSEQTARFLRGAQCEMTGNEIRTTPQPSHCSSGEFGNGIRQRFILLNQTLIPDIVSPVTQENFETWCFTIPWKPKHFPLVRIIYREGRGFVWFFRFNTGRTEHQLLFRCSSKIRKSLLSG